MRERKGSEDLDCRITSSEKQEDTMRPDDRDERVARIKGKKFATGRDKGTREGKEPEKDDWKIRAARAPLTDGWNQQYVKGSAMVESKRKKVVVRMMKKAA